MYQPELESMPRDDLEALQLRRLQGTLENIEMNNSTYHRLLGERGPEDVSSLEGLRSFPFISKEDIRRHYPFQLACAPQSDFVRMQMSSGTTGTPIICPHTEADLAQWSEIMARCLTAATLTREDVLQITPGFGLFNGGFGFHYGATALGTMIIPIGAGRSKLQLQFMRDLGTTALAAIASYPLRLIEVAAETGFDFHRDSHLRVGIFGAEMWSDEVRQRIEEELGIESFDIIGMTETAGVGMGIDCTAHAGVHVWEDHYYVEMIDPDSGDPVEDGEWGEMVVTTLTRAALPLIRFRTRDISRVVSRDRCACGRTSTRYDRIACRTDDMLKVKGVNFYPKQIESMLLRNPMVGSDYLIEIERISGGDHLRLKVEADQGDNSKLAKKLDEELHSLLGLHAEVVVLPMGGLPRPDGKAVRVMDRRPT